MARGPAASTGTSAAALALAAREGRPGRAPADGAERGSCDDVMRAPETRELVALAEDSSVASRAPCSTALRA